MTRKMDREMARERNVKVKREIEARESLIIKSRECKCSNRQNISRL